MASPEQTATGKDISNPFIADDLLKIMWLSVYLKTLGYSIIFNDSPLTGVNTPGSDENSMKLICFDVHLVICCCKEWSFHVCADHRDYAEDDSLLVLCYYNPLGMLY